MIAESPINSTSKEKGNQYIVNKKWETNDLESLKISRYVFK